MFILSTYFACFRIPIHVMTNIAWMTTMMIYVVNKGEIWEGAHAKQFDFKSVTEITPDQMRESVYHCQNLTVVPPPPQLFSIYVYMPIMASYL